MKAIARFARASPRKTNQVGRLIKGKPCPEAQAILRFVNKRPAKLVNKVLASAIANATRQPGVTLEELMVKNVIVNQGPRGQRYRAGAMGRTMPYVRRLCHVTVELDLVTSRKTQAISDKL